MRPGAPSSPTPAVVRALPAPAPVALNSARPRWPGALARSLGTVLLASGAAAGLRATWRLRRMRVRAATVVRLEHDVDLPGWFPPRRVVVLGDSAAAGHGVGDVEHALARRLGRGLVARDGRATEVRCVAVDGATTAEVLATQLHVAAGAEVVVIGLGVNDAVRFHRGIPAVVEDLRAVLVGVQARITPGGRVVLLSCPDLSAAPGLPAVFRGVLGRRCRALARAQTAVAAELDVHVIGAERAVLSPEVFGDDGFHPGALGHERLGVRVLEWLDGR